MSDTPRTDKWKRINDPIEDLHAFARQLERELNEANERIRLLIAERDTARRQADQNWKLREEFRALLGTDDVATALAVVREMKDRIKLLEEMYEGEIGENEQFLGSNLQGLLTRELNWCKERIKRLESWIESLEVLEQHSGILPEREWFGSEIGYLRKGEAVYKGEAKP